MTIRTTSLRAVAALSVGLAVLAGGGAAAAPVVLTVSSQYGPDKPQSMVWRFIERRLEEEMPGAFDVRLVTSGALGGEKEEAEGVRLGSIQGAMSTLANLTTWVPEGALFDMPFLFRDRAHIAAVTAGPVGDDLREAYAQEGFHVLGFVVFGARHLIGHQPFATPDTVAGKTMRVLQSELHIDLWDSLGADPTALPITEAYNALATGLVDMMDMTKSGFHALRLYEVAPRLTETGHIWAVGVIYVGTDLWARLTEEERTVLAAVGGEAADEFDAAAAAEQARALEEAVEGGAAVHEADLSAWRAAMEPVWRDWADRVGGMERIEAIASGGAGG